MENERQRKGGCRRVLSRLFLRWACLLLLLVPAWKSQAGNPLVPEDPGAARRGETMQQQRITLTGTVRDVAGEPLPGVNVVEKGTVNGTITAVDGRYSLAVPSGATLVFSFVGFKNVEIPVRSEGRIDVVLEEETRGIDEVVVTAMGIRSEKRRLNFAVQSVNSEDLSTGRQTNFVDALQGRIAGVEVSGTGGSPSASSQILISQFSFGLTNNFSIGAGLLPLFLFGGTSSPFWIVPKLSIPVVRDKFNIGTGAFLGTIIGEDTGVFGLLYGTTTFGSRDKNISFGLAYGFAQDEWLNVPVINISSMIRTGPKGYFITENYIISTEGVTVAILSFGGRSIIRNIGLDYSLWIPIGAEMDTFVAIPFLGITIPMGSKK